VGFFLALILIFSVLAKRLAGKSISNTTILYSGELNRNSYQLLLWIMVLLTLTTYSSTTVQPRLSHYRTLIGSQYCNSQTQWSACCFDDRKCLKSRFCTFWLFQVTLGNSDAAIGSCFTMFSRRWCFVCFKMLCFQLPSVFFWLLKQEIIFCYIVYSFCCYIHGLDNKWKVFIKT